jgi:hypothetical protein
MIKYRNTETKEWRIKIVKQMNRYNVLFVLLSSVDLCLIVKAKITTLCDTVLNVLCM